MPSCPRAEIVRDGDVGVYHCYSRCVRRTFLCGIDPATDMDYEYRRDWVCQFEKTLAGLFAIEVAFHAELSNHIHLVLRTRPDAGRIRAAVGHQRPDGSRGQNGRGSGPFGTDPGPTRCDRNSLGPVDHAI